MLQDKDKNAAAGLLFFVKVQVQGKTDKECIKVGTWVQKRKNNIIEDSSQSSRVIVEEIITLRSALFSGGRQW